MLACRTGQAPSLDGVVPQDPLIIPSNITPDGRAAVQTVCVDNEQVQPSPEAVTKSASYNSKVYLTTAYHRESIRTHSDEQAINSAQKELIFLQPPFVNGFTGR